MKQPHPYLDQLQAAVQQRLREAELFLGRTLPQPQVRLDQRGSAAGSACYGRGYLRFHPQLLSKQPEHFLRHVVAHEVAHWVVAHCHGRVAPHGREWQQLMRQVFGVPAERTHQYEVPVRSGQRFTYRCACLDGHELSLRRHRRVESGQTQYRCRRCQQLLQPVADGA